MLALTRLFKWGAGELLVILGLLVLINNYLLYEKVTIRADGEGYYDYLPALFIYGDFPKENSNGTSIYSDRIKQLGFYLDVDGSKLNKYPAGAAVLVLPFFNYAHLTARLQGFENDGFSLPYQEAMFYAAVFYLFLALIFLRRLLSLFNLSWPIVFIVQLLAVFSTSIINYVNYDPTFSHVYSFFAVTAFLFFTKSWFLTQKTGHFLWAATFLGLIIILRQINVIVILFIPFLAGSPGNLKKGIITVFKHKPALVAGSLILLSIVSIQLLLWYHQTGNLFVYSYKNEGFNFLSPAFYSILFSYRKGLFVYTPIAFLSLIGLLIFIKNKQYYLLWSWLLFFVIFTYIVSSWHSWVYGCSYGSRVYIDFYAIFMVLLGILFEGMKRWAKALVILVSLLTIPLNIIQTKQYKEFILHWDQMNKDSYWTYFLRTEKKFKGLLFKRTYSFNDQTTEIVHSVSLPNVVAEPNTITGLYSEFSRQIAKFQDVNIIQVVFDNDFQLKQDARMELNVRDSLTNEAYYFHNHAFIHFIENGLNRWQTGMFNYEFAPIRTENNCKINLLIFTEDKPVEFTNLKINYLVYRQ
ncbi:MAG: hypothetical protein U1C46_09655 [Bacteroidales bacterium]|nr:hypothetical protein [Bacteroidales bacterium]